MGRDHEYKLWVIHKDKEQLQNLRKFITKRIKACEEMSSFTELLEENGVDIPKGDWPRKTWTEARKFDYEGCFKIGKIEAYEYQNLSFKEIFEVKELPCLPISEDDFSEIPCGYRFKIEHERVEGYARIPFVGDDDELPSVISYLFEEVPDVQIRGFFKSHYSPECAGKIKNNTREWSFPVIDLDCYGNSSEFSVQTAVDSLQSEGLIPIHGFCSVAESLIKNATFIRKKLLKFYTKEEIPFDSQGKYNLPDNFLEDLEDMTFEIDCLTFALEEISVQQATAITKFKGSYIELPQLKSIPPKAVDILSRFEGTMILSYKLALQLFVKFDLDKKLKCIKKGLLYSLEHFGGDDLVSEIENITNLSPALARFLVEDIDPGIFDYQLSLNKIEALSASTAQILSSFEGSVLCGLREISDSTCSKLSNFKGKLFLENLKNISLSQAKSLSKCFDGLTWKYTDDISVLHLGIIQLSEEVAEALSCINGKLVFSNLSKLTPQAALKLSTSKFSLSFGSWNLEKSTINICDKSFENLSSGQTDELGFFNTEILTDAAAESLSKYKGDDLFLNGLTQLSDAAAESLSKFKGDLCLIGLTQLSDAAAESLSKCKGNLSLLGLERMSAKSTKAFSKMNPDYLSLSGEMRKKVNKYK